MAIGPLAPNLEFMIYPVSLVCDLAVLLGFRFCRLEAGEGKTVWKSVWTDADLRFP
jgi:hypothetical protein